MKCDEINYIQKLKKGDEVALDYIVDKYLPLVKGTVNKVLSPLKDAGFIEECINDIFLSVWNNSNKFHGDDLDFKKWIFVISKFKAIDYYRSRIRKDITILDSLETSNSISVEDELINIENRSELVKLINSLEVMDREIFILKYFLGYKSEDIAIKLGTTKASVDNRIYRGKIKLKKKIINLKLEVI